MSSALVLIFGEAEDDNDRRAIEYLVQSLKPKDVQVRCQRHRTPFILDRSAQRRKHMRACEEIAILASAATEAAKPGDKVLVVGFHDTDEVEPSHIKESQRIKNDLRAYGVVGVAATPACTIEAWWMLFPEALAQTRRCWASFKTSGNVGAIQQPKTYLTRKLRNPSNRKCPDYTETDSVPIARHIRDMNLATDNRTSICGSLAHFRDELRGNLATGKRKR